MIEYRVISDHRHLLAESPLWDEALQTLYWADLRDMKIYAYHQPSTKIIHYQLTETIGSIALAHEHHLLVALRSGIYLFNLQNEKLTHIVTPDGEPYENTRFNDGKIAPNGDFFVGTMDETFQSNIGKLYHISQQGQATLMKENFMVSNGLAWTQDGKKMYHACTRNQKIWRHDFSDSAPFISNQQVFADITPEIGKPDGGATDMDDCYWSAGVFSGYLNQFGADGTLLQHIALPMKAPTMPCFGGKNMQTLFLTSLSYNLEAQDFEDYPLSGAVIAIETNSTGVRIPRYQYQP